MSSNLETNNGETPTAGAASFDVDQFLGRKRPGPLDPFWRAVWRGAATILPPLLTFVIIIWVVTTINSYIFTPLKNGMKYAIFRTIADIKPTNSLGGNAGRDGNPAEINIDGRVYTRLAGGYIPKDVVDYIAEQLGPEGVPRQAPEAYNLYIELRYLKPHLVLPFLIALLILVLYLLGKFVTARVGRMAWSNIEQVFVRLPFVRSIYGAVKQVSDFLLAQRKVEFSRVVAVEWPRRGVWSIGLVTSESFEQIHKRAGRPVLAVFIPTSPAPMTGFTINVPVEDTIDLGISIDQALQYIVSCGVVVPRPGVPSGELVEAGAAKGA